MNNRTRRLLDAPPFLWREIGRDVVAVPPAPPTFLERLMAEGRVLRIDWAERARARHRRDTLAGLRMWLWMRRPAIEPHSDLGFAGDPVPPTNYVDLLDWGGRLVRRVHRPTQGAPHALEPAERTALDEFAAACGFTWDEWQRQVLASILRSSGSHL